MAGVFCRLTLPAIVTNLLGFITVITSTVIAGHLKDPVKIAAVGLANVVFSVMILSLLVGLNCAQETLTSQAFGAGNLRLCGVYLNRGCFILIVFFVVFAIMPAFFAEKILVAIGQDPQVSALAHTQIWYGLPAIFCFGQYDLYKRWLACQRITFVPLIAMIIATILHLPLSYLLAFKCGLDIRGLALASSIKDAALLSILVLYGRCSARIYPSLQPPLSAASFSGWGEYLKVSVPATVMICAEWWAFEILTVIAGLIGVEQ